MNPLDPLIVVRGVHVAATLLCCGTVCFMTLVAAPAVAAAPALRRRLTIMVWMALAVAVASGLAWLVLVAAGIEDTTPAAIIRDGGLWVVTESTRFGHVQGLRLVAALGLAIALRFAGARVLPLGAAAALVGLLAPIGHAGATPGPAGTVHLISDLVHVLAATAWLGGLPALAMTLRSGSGHPALADAARSATSRFSVLGLFCVAALLVSGAINSFLLLGGPGDLTATRYGQLLLLKVAIFAAMIAIAAINRYRLTPRLPTMPAMRALARNALIEASLGLCIILVVGALGTLPPHGHVHTNAAASTSEAAYVHIHGDAIMADVSITPGTTGRAAALIRVTREDSTSYPVKSLRLGMRPREGTTVAIGHDAVLGPDDDWHVSALVIPSPGVWIVTVTIDAGETQPIELDAPIVIMQCSNECW